MKKKLLLAAVAAIALSGTYISPVHADNSGGQQNMYRLYNPNSGEHFYTASEKERDHLDQIGWNYEGVGWVAPEKSDTPVYRLYNKNGGEHHYTMSSKERDGLVSVGWKDEGIGWYSDDNKTVPLLREYNPNKFSCNHNYTTSQKEHSHLVSIGWKDEGTAWYGVSAGDNTSQNCKIIHHDAVTHQEKVQTGTKTVIDKDAYDEQVDTGHTAVVCNRCGKKFYDSDAPELKINPENGAYYIGSIGGEDYNEFSPKSTKAMIAYLIHRIYDEKDIGGYYTEPIYKTVHHDAVTHEEPVYETKTVVDTPAWDETVCN